MKLLIILLILSSIFCLINCKSPKTTQKAKTTTQKAESTASNRETTTGFPKIFDFKPKVKLDHDELVEWDFSKFIGTWNLTLTSYSTIKYDVHNVTEDPDKKDRLRRESYFDDKKKATETLYHDEGSKWVWIKYGAKQLGVKHKAALLYFKDEYFVVYMKNNLLGESISAFEVSKDKSKLGKKDEKFYRNEVIGKIQKKTQDKIEHLTKKLKWVPEQKEKEKKKRHQRFLQDQKHHHHHEEQESGDTALQHSRE